MAIESRCGKSAAADTQQKNRCGARHAVLVMGAEASPVRFSIVSKREEVFTLTAKEAAPASAHILALSNGRRNLVFFSNHFHQHISSTPRTSAPGAAATPVKPVPFRVWRA
ncbi:hypothetical protein [Paraburkholderia sp. HD33-4]|uniref:hypothetical protein n=1 Tax=Paraburkholderia sp. HD33-4 TaxID=2883242 RepID=UPI001F2B2204|nr:hypothetical protein [Paraburkholderia sp. HD33-4]